MTIAGLPNWAFVADEISVGVYRIKGRHNVLGIEINFTDTDEDNLMRNAEKKARELERRILEVRWRSPVVERDRRGPL